MKRNGVFVTVGSTKFDAMISEVCKMETLEVLAEKGYEEVLVQIGHGTLPQSVVTESLLGSQSGMDEKERYNNLTRKLDDGLEVSLAFSLLNNSQKSNLKVFRFKASIAREMASAGLVLSHAGAGSALEALGQHKPLITVINDMLMDQHQSELAEKLSSMGYSVACKPQELRNTLNSFDETSLKKYVPGEPDKFVKYLNSVFLCYNN